MRRNHWITAIASALLATACATTSPPPTSALVETRASVRVAEKSGADRDPQAAQYLQLARHQLAEAERLTREGSNWSANRRLEEAQVNADMASELARQASLRADAAQTQRDIDALRTGQ